MLGAPVIAGLSLFAAMALYFELDACEWILEKRLRTNTSENVKKFIHLSSITMH